MYLASRGLPRVVNQVCDYALVYAFTDGLERADAWVIDRSSLIGERAAASRRYRPETGERKTFGNVDLKFYLGIFLRRLLYFIGDRRLYLGGRHAVASILPPSHGSSASLLVEAPHIPDCVARTTCC